MELIILIFSINPATSLSWTKDDINDIIAGVYFDTTKSGKAIDQLYIEVDYTENPPYDFYLWSASLSLGNYHFLGNSLMAGKLSEVLLTL